METLDKKDKRLIAELINNCRNSDKYIAKKIGVSREVVSYRVKSLEKLKIINGYTADINFNKLGFTPYSISIKFQSLTSEKEKKIVNELINQKKIIFLQKTLSKYDLTATILVKSIQELDNEITSIRELIGKNLKKLEVEAFVGDYDFLSSFFDKTSRGEINFLDNNLAEIDETDKKILLCLVKDSRQTAVEISKKTNLNVFTVANRIKRMTKDKIILAFRPLIDMKKIGQYRYTLLLNLNGSNIEKELISFCRNQVLVWDIGKFVGNYNYAIELYAENNEQVKNFVDEIVGKFSNNIIDYEILVILDELKHNYFFS